MKLNIEHYRKVWKARYQDGTPRYSFLYGKFISVDDGYRIKAHSLEGTKVVFGDNDEVFTIGSVHLHFYKGYHFHILAHNKNNSTKTFSVNINDTSGVFRDKDCKLINNQPLTLEMCEWDLKQ